MTRVILAALWCAALFVVGGGSAAAAGTTLTLDGAVYGQPVVSGDTIYAATENGTVYAVANSAVRWQTHVADPIPESSLPCGDIDPEGITGRPALDTAAHRLYVVAETSDAHHVLFGLDSESGAVTMQLTIDPPFGDSPSYLQRPALTLANGHVYAAFGGNAGDCGNYTGAVAAVDLSNNSVAWYQSSTSGRGGIWAPGSPAQAGGLLYYSVGNGNAGPGADYDNTDSVVALTPDLRRADFFAPATWAADNAADKDLGSMNPALVGSHIVIAGKAGDGYVLDAAHLGGISSVAPAFTGCRAFGGAAVADDIAYLPCTTGTTAVRIAADGTATVLWHATVPANGQPILASGHVWVTDWHSGTLYALDPATGAATQQFPTDTLPHFATPAAAGSTIVLGTMTGLAFFPAP
ncbi:PQQ-binding-like beta-propeller repeat protein [Nocardia terpenica]|uniref:outer membrane protein assembly factor BamB family protein n=1 Tax=Nocardia terpenica TaxID=455432 RepID=UPI00189592AC|nr:PQQ-binding-like beta-propeller repeat protein [Nocardia terpenica]MBF6065681.1 PQQ-binding-like beta-propeller repeat protein [Nocardia terpenica]MBF6108281.1 PQQ-binding-like beta-propeller repeat protein [Nocardia terpenica]MBF6115796.1 PQQ-binding-like beta-propeller repeat protein [Nocardia terpenica]MBF6122926.1 PQQ-binding-like beta-propeller repeat protein [Nocardia terpenica]MBF6156001.1 PQQ-binding-like beta-propeller repeat protein [Nocardia terpenica]